MKGKGARRRRSSGGALSPKLMKTAERAVAAHQAGDLVTAERDYRAVLARAPAHPDLALNLALILAGSGRATEALTVLSPAAAANPDNASLTSTLANLQLECGDATAAAQTFTRVLAQDPGNLNARFNLAGVLHRAGDHRKAAEHLRTVAHAAPGDEGVLTALVRVLLADGNTVEAREVVDTRLAQLAASPARALALGQTALAEGNQAAAMAAFDEARALAPGDADTLEAVIESLRGAGADEALRALLEALAGEPGGLTPDARRRLVEHLLAAGEETRALPLLEEAVREDPGWVPGHVQLATSQVLSGEESRAREVLEALVERFQARIDVLGDAGLVFRIMGDGQRARSLFEAALALAPEDAGLCNALGLCLVDEGDMEGAEAAFDAALAREPGNGHAWYNRSRTRRYRDATDPFVVALLERASETVTNAGIDADSASMTGYACGKVFDDLGRPAEAFEHYDRANRLQRDLGPRYDAGRQDQLVERVRRTLTPDRLHAPDGGQADGPLPVFIIGMPRSGTTLVEQILASHPSVHGAGELRDLATLAREAARLTGAGYPEAVVELDDDQARELGRRYGARIASLAGGATCVTDKLPTNFQYLGLASRILGEVRIVHCRRDPMDTCLANWIQHFAEGHRYANDLGDIAHFYARYLDFMTHWEAVLPVPILHVDYEAVVEDVEREARRLVDFVGLPWDDACARFHESTRKVETASNWQVRQPIYRHASRRWKRYEAHLGGLRADLERLVPGLQVDAD